MLQYWPKEKERPKEGINEGRPRQEEKLANGIRETFIL